MHTDPVTTRAALAAGMTADQLRSKRWVSPLRGVHVERAAASGEGNAPDPCDLHITVRALVAVTNSHVVVSDRTAAELYEWWLPAPDHPCTHITVAPDAVVERPGVRCHRRILTQSDVRELRGVPITSPARTLVDLASEFCLIDLVVAMDAALHFGHCTMNDLHSSSRTGGWRGVRTFRRALSLADSRSESPMESLMRLLIVLSGLPPPIPQAKIFDANGFFVGRGDLKAPGVRAVFEYDGATHNEPLNHAKDVTRWRNLRAANCEVFPYTARELFQSPQQIVADYQRVLSLPIDPTAIRGWWIEWRKSEFRRRGYGE